MLQHNTESCRTRIGNIPAEASGPTRPSRVLARGRHGRFPARMPFMFPGYNEGPYRLFRNFLAADPQPTKIAFWVAAPQQVQVQRFSGDIYDLNWQWVTAIPIGFTSPAPALPIQPMSPVRTSIPVASSCNVADDSHLLCQTGVQIMNAGGNSLPDIRRHSTQPQRIGGAAERQFARRLRRDGVVYPVSTRSARTAIASMHIQCSIFARRHSLVISRATTCYTNVGPNPCGCHDSKEPLDVAVTRPMLI